MAGGASPGSRRTRTRGRGSRQTSSAAAFPFPIAPYYIVALDTLVEFRRAHEVPTVTPVRLELPQMDDGPHLNYAIQWFTFAVMALVGVGTLIAQDVRRGQRRPALGRQRFPCLAPPGGW